MPDVVLTLQIPKGSRFVPIAMTADQWALSVFKRVVLTDWKIRCQTATDELEAIVQRAEYEKLAKVLNLLIPKPNEEAAEGEQDKT
ncbi:hypothetical protein ACFLYE_00230 [Chloroflexota bacterium]